MVLINLYTGWPRKEGKESICVNYNIQNKRRHTLLVPKTLKDKWENTRDNFTYKFKKLSKMDRSLKRSKLPKLTQEEIDHLNVCIFVKKFERMVKSLQKQTKQKSRPIGFHWWILSDILGRTNANSTNSSLEKPSKIQTQEFYFGEGGAGTRPHHQS